MKSEVRYMVIELDSQYEKRKQEIEKIVKNVAIWLQSFYFKTESDMIGK